MQVAVVAFLFVQATCRYVNFTTIFNDSCVAPQFSTQPHVDLIKWCLWLTSLLAMIAEDLPTTSQLVPFNTISDYCHISCLHEIFTVPYKMHPKKRVFLILSVMHWFLL